LQSVAAVFVFCGVAEAKSRRCDSGLYWYGEDDC